MFQTKGEKIFQIINYTGLTFVTIMCLFPVLHIVALSLSSSHAAAAGWVTLFPKQVTLQPYKYALGNKLFASSFIVSIKRVVLGVSINMILTVVTAYPLSRPIKEFKSRTFYAWFIFIPMILSGGLIPIYLIVAKTGLIDTIWALILPAAIPIFNVVIMLNFFKRIPNEISESAFMDGAGHIQVLIRIFLPLSLPSLATLTLFAAVFHWNSWFDGLIYMNRIENYPLQTYLRSLVIVKDFSTMSNRSEFERIAEISDRTLQASQIVIGAIPILAIYPFLQRYFIKGLVLGSVKG